MTYVRRKHSLTHLEDSIVTFHDQRIVEPHRSISGMYSAGDVFGITVGSRAFSLNASLKTIAERREAALSRDSQLRPGITNAPGFVRRSINPTTVH